jgi:hypothetical protein
VPRLVVEYDLISRSFRLEALPCRLESFLVEEDGGSGRCVCVVVMLDIICGGNDYLGGTTY